MSVFIKALQAFVNIICGSSTRHDEQQQPTEQQPTGVQPSLPAHPKPQSPGPQKNSINQHAEHYVSLRARANEEGDQMARCFQESHEAYSRGDGAGAKSLSNQGREHQRRMEELNREACEWIFRENNKDSPLGEIDLHGLYVKEAISQTDRALEQAKQRGDLELRLIVGKGLHSQGGAAKIKPAIEDLIEKHELKAQLDPENSGVLIVQLNAGHHRGIASDEITRQLEKDDEGCCIM